MVFVFCTPEELKENKMDTAVVVIYTVVYIYIFFFFSTKRYTISILFEKRKAGLAFGH